MGVLVYLWLQDTDRVAAELQRWANQNSDYAITLAGPVQWQLWPEVYLQLNDVVVADETQTLQVQQLEVSLNTQALWDSISNWRVDALQLTEARLIQQDAPEQTLVIHSAQLRDITYDHPMPLEADFTLTEAATAADGDSVSKPLSGTITTALTYSPATSTSGQRITLNPLTLDSSQGGARCEVNASEQLTPRAVRTGEDDLLPLDTLANYNFAAECDLTDVQLDAVNLAEAHLTLNNAQGTLDITFDTPQIHSGNLQLNVSITHTSTLTWQVETQFADVRIEQLLNNEDDRANWQGPISGDGQFTLQGNTQEQLQNSVQGTVEFRSAAGQIDVSRVKQQMLQLAALTNKAADVQRWPDAWPYQMMQGRWRVNASQHQLNMAIDNMSINANGSYDIANDQLNLLSEVTIHPTEAATDFTINPLLIDTPVPIRCRGSGFDPTCRLDEKAGQNLLAQSLRRDSDTGVRRKLEEKIEEEVPAEYREVARDLLDLLGRALERD